MKKPLSIVMAVALAAGLGLVWVTAASPAPASPAPALHCAASSAAGTRAAVVELYTSQGCSSCPPADRWLSRLSSHHAADGVIPLAFHVDYWNDLGWKDPFSRPEFSQRQRELAVRAGTGLVYTPAVFIDGREHRRWDDAAATQRAIDAAKGAAAGISLDVDVERDGERLSVGVRASPPAAVPGVDLVLALTQSGRSTSVAAGENRGATLLDDDVVRAWLSRRLSPAGAERLELELPGDGPREFALAALAYDGRTGSLLQGVRLDLGSCRDLRSRTPGRRAGCRSRPRSRRPADRPGAR